MRKTSLCFVLGWALILADAPPASAGTARFEGTLDYHASSLKPSNVTVTANLTAGGGPTRTFTISDDQGVSPATGCTAINPNSVTCAGPNQATSIVIATTNQVDQVTMNANARDTATIGVFDGNDIVNGGPEIDVVTGGSNADTLKGGAGNDTIIAGLSSDQVFGGDGNDLLYGGDLWGAGGSGGGGTGGSGGDSSTGGTTSAFDGDDILNGGNGTDTVSYRDRLQEITVTLDGVANDGASFEHDNISFTENVTGGLTNDKITGSTANNSLVGDTGNDNLSGSFGNDVVLGGRGSDTMSGGEGTDDMDAVDGDADIVQCGGGSGDLAELDLKDRLSPVSAHGCESVEKFPIDVQPPLRIIARPARMADDGTVRLRVHCRSSSRCSGVLRLSSTGKLAGRQRKLGTRGYKVRGRSRAVIALRLTRANRRLVRRARKLQATATARERDHRGRPKTAIVRLRLSA